MRNRPSLTVVLVALLFGGGVIATIANALGGGEDPQEPAGAVVAAADSEPQAATGNDRLSPGELRAAAKEVEEKEHALEQDGVEDLLEPAPGEASEQGAPAAVAERFAALWVNRSDDPQALRRQRTEMVALAHGPFARSLYDEIDRALKSAGKETSIEGSVTIVEEIDVTDEGAQVLVVARERLTLAGEALEPYRYATYLARLIRLEDGYAINSWEPQR